MLTALLLSILIICVITDVKSRKIYNKVIFPSLLLGIILNGILFGWTGVTTSLLGFLTGFAILLIPYLMGGMGAGDVKLLALIGAFQGTSFVFATAIYMAVIGGIVGLLVLFFRIGLSGRLKQMAYLLCGIRYGIKPSFLPFKEGLQTTYPYGVAIAGGAITTMMVHGVVSL
ncbi:A24 family peptidase [Terrihalobacillus insolitus]|uniref:A24 family peptidase n=1 Tax=Terrihalobacillus insolitus TaxID=2950438 RepID=UPI00234132DC|nr:prepilin peptidase [Terrihalobacillus insolitus]MDC3413650.1 prepilin peptidase [Terrihalobacillus insolitus]